MSPCSEIAGGWVSDPIQPIPLGLRQWLSAKDKRAVDNVSTLRSFVLAHCPHARRECEGRRYKERGRREGETPAMWADALCMRSDQHREQLYGSACHSIYHNVLHRKQPLKHKHYMTPHDRLIPWRRPWHLGYMEIGPRTELECLSVALWIRAGWPLHIQVRNMLLYYYSKYWARSKVGAL